MGNSKVRSEFFERVLRDMEAHDGHLEEVDGIDPEDRSVVFMLQKTFFCKNDELRAAPKKDQLAFYCRNSKAVTNMVLETGRKAPNDLSSVAELVIAGLVASELLNDQPGLPREIWATLSDIQIHSEGAVKFFTDEGFRFFGIPPAVSELLENCMDRTHVKGGKTNLVMAAQVVMDVIELAKALEGNKAIDEEMAALFHGVLMRREYAIQYLLRELDGMNLPDTVLQSLKDALPPPPKPKAAADDDLW